MVNNYSSFVVVVVLAFYLSPFSGLKLGHVIMSVCVATSLFSSAKPISKLIDTAERMLGQSQIS